MAKVSIDDILESIEGMTGLELDKLAKAIEEKFGVSGASFGAGASGPSHDDDSAPAAAAGPSEVNLIIKSVGQTKVAVIKAVQAITGLGLMDAKKLVDVVPATINEKISPVEAEEHKKNLVAAGAEVEIK
jgi:large subunit ribosomal protein L7/L12